MAKHNKRWYLAVRILPILLLSLALADLSGAQPEGPPQNDLVYEIFVRSFCDGDQNADGIGDLKGIIKQLDTYLNDGKPETDHDLEAGILWLMPVFPSTSYHGYDVTDFRNIHPHYGTLDDFKHLIEEAHKRGVRIILDIPFNHTSKEHPWFKEALTDPDSPYRSYYHIKAGSTPGAGWHQVKDAGGRDLVYLGIFSPVMPDLNIDNPAVRKEISAIAKFWLDLGVDGFRLDAAKHIYGDHFGSSLKEEEILKNNDWWRDFSFEVYRQNPNAVLVGEVLGNDELLRRHAWGLDALISEPCMERLRSQAITPDPGFLGWYRGTIEAARELNRSAYEPGLPFSDRPFEWFPYLASHDKNPRLASHCEYMRLRGMRPSVEQAYRQAFHLLLTLPGYPIIYQGDELMQRGWKWNGNRHDAYPNPGDGSGFYDETLREPLPWYQSGSGPGQTYWFRPRFDAPEDGISVEEEQGSGSMLSLVRGLTNLRARHPAFAHGDIGTILNDSADWMVFERVSGEDHYLVLINLTPNGKDYRFHARWFPRYRGSRLLFWSDGAAGQWKDTSGENQHIDDSVYVPGYGLVVMRESPGA